MRRAGGETFARPAHDRGLVATTLWAIASVAFLSAGFGLLGVRRLYRHWQVLGLTAITSSIVMLATFRPPTAALGVLIDIALLAVLGFVSVPRRGWSPPRHRAVAATGRTAVFLFLGYVAAAILSRPWHSRWGSSAAELGVPLPGDDLVPVANYTVQHAVTIQAPPEAVWPWLVQLGQDRGGFYSYDWLERLVGDEVRNADRIHTEWQTLRMGDLVRATQPDYLGGILGPNVGWRVVHLEPQRAIVLGGWGAFVLEPRAGHTRLIVRTRGAGTPNVPLAPLGLLIFEPAHFMMERRMLLGIKERAERMPAAVRPGVRSGRLATSWRGMLAS